MNTAKKKAILRLVAVFAISLIAFSCTDPAPAAPEVELSISLKKDEVDYTAGSCWISVTASSSWTLVFKTPVDWASLSETIGTGSKSDLVLSWDENNGSEVRECTVVLSDGKNSVEANFRQKPSPSETLVSDTIHKWMELPAVDSDLYFITHPMTVGSVETRNYSFGWDLDALVARWVAYPLNSSMMGSVKRSDEWGLDPKLPRSCQPVLFSAYSLWGVRGHQLPSADRTLTHDQNVETFYGTNMTPQDYDFNSGTWAQLENYVRTKCTYFDTLYVVTGCILGGTSYAKDNEGKHVSIPTGYYKALLGYKRSGTIGNSSVQGGYTGTAFYFDSNSDSYSGFKSQMLTIDELESKLGMDFFVNLQGAIGKSLASKVESTKDNWWN